MDVIAHPSTGQPVTLGAIAAHIWVNGFRFDHERVMDFPLPVRGTRPTPVDLEQRVITFGFAAGRSLDSLFDALTFLTSHPTEVPSQGNLEFISENKSLWLVDCGIPKVSLVQKNGCLVVFGYEITGGYWASEPPVI